MLRRVSLVLAIAFSAAGASAQEERLAKPVAPEATRAPVRGDVNTTAFDGNTLRMTIANPPFLPGRESRIVLTRVE
jgi:hypothetical protein